MDKPPANGAGSPALAPAAQAVRAAVMALPLNRLPFLAGGAAAMRPPQKEGEPSVLVFTWRIACTLSSGRELILELPLGMSAHALAEHFRNVAAACDTMEADAARARALAANEPQATQPGPPIIDLSGAPSYTPPKPRQPDE